MLDGKENDGGEWKLVCSVVGKVLKGPTSSPPGVLLYLLSTLDTNALAETRLRGCFIHYGGVAAHLNDRLPTGCWRWICHQKRKAKGPVTSEVN